MIIFQIFIVSVLLHILWSLCSENFRKKRKQRNNLEFQRLTVAQREFEEKESYGEVNLDKDGIEYNEAHFSWKNVVHIFSEKIDINILEVVSLGFEVHEEDDQFYIQIHEKTKGFNKVTKTLQKFIDLEENWYKKVFAEAGQETKTIWKRT